MGKLSCKGTQDSPNWTEFLKGKIQIWFILHVPVPSQVFWVHLISVGFSN